MIPGAYIMGLRRPAPEKTIDFVFHVQDLFWSSSTPATLKEQAR